MHHAPVPVVVVFFQISQKPCPSTIHSGPFFILDFGCWPEGLYPHPPPLKVKAHVYNIFLNTYQDVLDHVQTYQFLIPLLFLVADLEFMNLLDDVGIAGTYTREALSNSSISICMRPPRAGKHTKKKVLDELV